MLFHHDSRDYETAARSAKIQAEEKLTRIIDKGRVRAGQVIESVMNQVPHDRLVPAKDLRFLYGNQGVAVRFGDGGEETFHNHALNQLGTRAGIPKSFMDRLTSKTSEADPIWGAKLLAHNLNELYGHDDGAYLTRSVEGQVRGFLSDRFKRIDCRPTVERFIQACQAIGAVPIEGYHAQVKTAIKAVIPQVFEPVENEVMVFGISLINSDFGAGALSVKPFCLRLWCTNYAIMEQAMRQVHLGSKLEENDIVYFSQDTMQKEAALMAQKVQEVITGALSPRSIQDYCKVIEMADDHNINFKAELEKLRKKGLTKAESEQVTDVWLNGGIDQLPTGTTQWRLSNAVSWVAGATESAMRKLDLMEMAGKLLPEPPRD